MNSGFDILAFFNALVYANFGFYIGERFERYLHRKGISSRMKILLYVFAIAISIVGIYITQKYIELYTSALFLALFAFAIKAIVDSVRERRA